MARPKSEDKNRPYFDANRGIAQSGIAASTALIARAGVAEGTPVPLLCYQRRSAEGPTCNSSRTSVSQCS